MEGLGDYRGRDPGQISSRGWVTKPDVVAFRVSAHRADVIGTEARHARNSRSTPTTRTMTLAEGEIVRQQSHREVAGVANKLVTITGTAFHRQPSDD
jgi:hypothetical protein